ncbi:ZN131 protein, partial [Grallaria varia]|nr:ZN131 protein [Grallaria varia]
AMEAEEPMECIQEFPEHYKVILDRLNEQREQDQFTDITLIVDGHHFKAHKAVLAACSQFFHKFFQDFTQEPLVEIEGVSNMAFRHLIEFTYTAKLMVQGEEEANDVWKAAEYLQMLEAIKALEISTEIVSRILLQQLVASILQCSSLCWNLLNLCRTIYFSTMAYRSELHRLKKRCHIHWAGNQWRVTWLLNVAKGNQSTLKNLCWCFDFVQLSATSERISSGLKTSCCKINLSDFLNECNGYSQFYLSSVFNQMLLWHLLSCIRKYTPLPNSYMRNMGASPIMLFFIPLPPFHFHKVLSCSHSYWHLLVLDPGAPCTYVQRKCHKIHVCQYWDKQFDHFGHFKEHLRKHTGEKPFECPNCHERFARNSTLKCHLTACQSGAGAKKGRKKLYECQVCNSVFNSWDQFKDHLVIHTGDKPNHCTLCDLWFMQGSELRRHLKEMHDIAELLVTEEVLPVEAVEAEPVTSMTIIEQVEQVHVLPVIQVQVDPAQVTVEQMHQDLIQDNQVKGTQMDELQEQVQISYLEVEHIQTEQGAEVHVEQLHVEHVNQIQVEEVQAELIDGTDLEQVEYQSVDQGEAEEKEPNQIDDADKEHHEQAEDLKTQELVDTQNENVDN